MLAGDISQLPGDPVLTHQRKLFSSTQGSPHSPDRARFGSNPIAHLVIVLSGTRCTHITAVESLSVRDTNNN